MGGCEGLGSSLVDVLHRQPNLLNSGGLLLSPSPDLHSCLGSIVDGSSQLLDYFPGLRGQVHSLVDHFGAFLGSHDG